MNVQQVIIKGIKEQLFCHDYLVLPDFGGFVLKINPTHFQGPGLIMPASKTISFNAQLKQNDGILAVWLQHELTCTANESLIHLKEFAEFCNSVLFAKRRLTLDGIGFFYLDFENNLCFEPKQDSNFLTSSFGLSPVLVKELEPERTTVKREEIFNDRKLTTPEIQTHSQKRSLNYRRILAVTGSFALLFGLLVIFISNNKFSGQLKASVFGSYKAGVYHKIDYGNLNLSTPDIKNNAYVADANGIATLELNDRKSVAVKAVEDLLPKRKLKILEKRAQYNGSKDYQVVLGCFSVLQNAQRMVTNLSRQNLHAVISERNANGLYTVSNGNFESKSEAVVRLQELKTGFPNAWIKNP